jgi:hydrogenase 3 maturation protease
VLLIVDAVHSGGKPGEIVFARAERLQPSGPSTHSLSFTMLAKTLPGVEVFILGVQPESVEFGEPMSPEAKGGAELVAKALDRTLGILK